MATTLFLMPDSWDLALDSSGNIAVGTDIYQQAQDISSACRVFRYDLYYDQQAGIPYQEEILGKRGFPLSLYKSYLEEAARSVQGVSTVSANLDSRNGRDVTGAILFTNENNEQGMIAL